MQGGPYPVGRLEAAKCLRCSRRCAGRSPSRVHAVVAVLLHHALGLLLERPRTSSSTTAGGSRPVALPRPAGPEGSRQAGRRGDAAGC